MVFDMKWIVKFVQMKGPGYLCLFFYKYPGTLSYYCDVRIQFCINKWPNVYWVHVLGDKHLTYAMISNSSMNLFFYVSYLCDLYKLTWSAYRFTMSNWTMKCWSMSLLIKDIQVIGGIPVIPSQILGNKTFSPIFSKSMQFEYVSLCTKITHCCLTISKKLRFESYHMFSIIKSSALLWIRKFIEVFFTKLLSI